MNKEIYIYGEPDESGNYISLSIRTYSEQVLADIKNQIAASLFLRMPFLQNLFIQLHNGNVEFLNRHVNQWQTDSKLWKEKNWQLLEETSIIQNKTYRTRYQQETLKKLIPNQTF